MTTQVDELMALAEAMADAEADYRAALRIDVGVQKAGQAFIAASAALRAAIVEAVAWRPISTAPKDGTTILVNDTTEGWTPWVAASWSEGLEWSGWTYDDSASSDTNPPLGPNPTHWMPLSPPPALQQMEGER